MKQLIILILAAFAIVGCTKKNSNYAITGDYMIVGRAGGFTAADAKTTYYLITTTELREDNTVSAVSPYKDVNQFNFNSVRPVSEFNAVKNLRMNIPAELLTRNGQLIGNVLPDAGYTDVRASINGVVYGWKFEADQDSSSAAVQQFVDSALAVFR